MEMSRIGKKPIEIPSGVTVKIEDGSVSVKGPLGQLTKRVPEAVRLEMADNAVLVRPVSEDKKSVALQGTVRAIVANMVEGVTKGFEKRMEIVGTGYRAQMSGKNLVLQVGFSHPVTVEPPQGIQIAVESPNKFAVKGIDKELVGKVAAEIRDIKRPEPYKGKGIRYEGEHVRRKAGKAGAVGQSK